MNCIGLLRETADDVKIPYPATQSSNLGLLSPYPQLRKQDLRLDVLFVGEGAGYSCGQVGALGRVCAGVAGLTEVIYRDSEILARLRLGQAGMLREGCERLDGDIKLFVGDNGVEVFGVEGCDIGGSNESRNDLGQFLWQIGLLIALALGGFGLGHVDWVRVDVD